MRVAKTVLLAIATVTGALAPAHAQSVAPPPNVPPVTTIARGAAIPPLGFFVMGTVAVAAVSPMIATAILGRELTIGEAYHVILGSTLGPVGWLAGGCVVSADGFGSDEPSRKTAAQTGTRRKRPPHQHPAVG